MSWTYRLPTPSSKPVARLAPWTRVAAPRSLAAAILLGATTLGATAHADAQAASATAPAAQQGAAPQPTAEMRAVINDRLARSFAQRARNLLQREQVYIGMLDSAETLIRVSTTLAPDNPFIWRIALDLATTMEDGDPAAAEMSSLALRRLNELVPENESIRLRRILDSISKRQTAEERFAMYDRLLAPESVARIGNSVAARLAFDCAVLRRRSGDIAGFERELLHAVDLDPSYPEATEMAAGFFRMRTTSPVEDAEAMRVSLIANPIRTPAALGLASLCLEKGAYKAAAEILDVEAEVLATPKPDPVYDGVLTDLTVALWGSDQLDAAFALLTRRQRVLDMTLLAQLDEKGAIMSLEERAKVKMPVAPQLAATFAAVANVLKLADAKGALENCAFAYQTQVEAYERILRDPERKDVNRERITQESVATRLEGAVVQLWLGGDITKAAGWVDEVAAKSPLSDDAAARFAGWILLRKGEAERARQTLEPIAERDLTARLGLAVACEQLGDRKAAAKAYLEVARAMPNTAMGLWAREKLRAVLGQKVEVLEGADKVEAVAKLPPAFLELMRDGSRKILVRIVPERTNVRPWDALLFDVELTNLSEWPLAIAAEGPIADTMTITAAVNVPGKMPATPPLTILSLDQKLVIPARQSIRVPLDVSLTDASVALRDDPINGAFLSVHGILNWRTTAEGLEPGPLGAEVESQAVHVSGARLTPEWIKQRFAEIGDQTKVPDPETIAFLAHAHRRTAREGDGADPKIREALAGTGPALADAARRLWPEARAWLTFAAPPASVANDVESTQESAAATARAAEQQLSMTAPVPELEPLMAVLRDDQGYLQRLAWVAVRVLRPEDAVLEATLASTDPKLAAFAKTFKAWLVDVQEQRRRELNLK